MKVESINNDRYIELNVFEWSQRNAGVGKIVNIPFLHYYVPQISITINLVSI
jgi:hypothetical protein